MATSIRYNDEVRAEKDYFSDVPSVKVSKDMLDLAEHILESKRGKFDPSKFEDRYEKALKSLIKAKGAGKDLPEAPEPPPSNVINLMDALRRSVKGESGGKEEKTKRGSSARRTSSRSSSGRRATAKRRMKKAG
jgi:DNA end-binding protein Ku